MPFWNHPRALYAEKGVVAPRIIIINFQIALIIGFLSEMFSLLKKLMGKEAKEGFTRVRVRYVSCNRYFNINKARKLLVNRAEMKMMRKKQWSRCMKDMSRD